MLHAPHFSVPLIPHIILDLRDSQAKQNAGIPTPHPYLVGTRIAAARHSPYSSPKSHYISPSFGTFRVPIPPGTAIISTYHRTRRDTFQESASRFLSRRSFRMYANEWVGLHSFAFCLFTKMRSKNLAMETPELESYVMRKLWWMRRVRTCLNIMMILFE